MKNKENKTICLLIILLFISCICWGFYYWKSQHSLNEYEKQVNKITEIDYSSRQEALNQVVEEGMINIQYSIGAKFKGKVSESFNVKNSINNHFPLVFELFDPNGKSIYKSKLIDPGYEINSIELTKELSKGIHDCTIKIGYANSGNVSSIFPITIEVN